MRVERGADLLQDRVRLRQVFVVGAFALDQIGHRVEPQAVDAEVEPEPHDAEHRLQHARIVEVEVGLVASRSGASNTALATASQRPVRFLGVDENDARARVVPVVVGPDIEIARRASPASRGGRAGTRGAGRRCG